MNGTDNKISKHYTLGEMIANGGMGIVYKGTDTRTNTPVAIKQLKASAVAASSSMVARFEREAESLRRLNHPNIVKVLDTVKVDETHYIVMEYVAGGTLRDLIDAGNPIPLKRALTIMLELADALTRAHHLGIVHRDLKPGNILLAEDGTPRLTDFGVARMENRERLTDEDISVGTLDYISPEVLDGQEADKRSDVWSFGVIMYELIAGIRPFAAATTSGTVAAILAREPADIRTYNSEIPQGLAYLVESMVMRNPNLRLGSIRQVAAELEAILQEEDSLPTIIGRFRTPAPQPIGDFSTPIVGVFNHKRQKSVPRIFPADDSQSRTLIATVIGLITIGALFLALIVNTASDDATASADDFNLQEAAIVTEVLDLARNGIDREPLASVPLTAKAGNDGLITYDSDLYALRATDEWGTLDIDNTLAMLDRVTDGSDTFTAIIGERDKLDLITANILRAEGVAIRREALPEAFTTEELLGWIPFMLAEINLPVREDSETIIETEAGEMVRVELGVEDRFIGPDNFQVYFIMDRDMLYWIIFYTPEDSFDHLTEEIDQVLHSFRFK